MKPKILVSGCLLGNPTRYDGKSKRNEAVCKLKDVVDFIVICPEHDGGLPIPRDPCEIQGNKVISLKGRDCTFEYTKGATMALEAAKRDDIHFALLKEKSPSCGIHKIHNGKFDGGVIDGQGVTAKLLTSNRIEVFDEDEIDLLLEKIKSTSK